HAKGLFPLNRVEEATRSTEQVHFLLHSDRTNILYLLIIYLRLDHLFKVAYRVGYMSINSTREYNRYASLFCCFNSKMRSLFREQAAQPNKEVFRLFHRWLKL